MEADYFVRGKKTIRSWIDLRFQSWDSGAKVEELLMASSLGRSTVVGSWSLVGRGKPRRRGTD